MSSTPTTCKEHIKTLLVDLHPDTGSGSSTQKYFYWNRALAACVHGEETKIVNRLERRWLKRGYRINNATLKCYLGRLLYVSVTGAPKNE